MARRIRLVKAIHPRPELGAATCCFLAFRDSGDIARNAYAYAYRPTGGPHVLARMRNVLPDCIVMASPSRPEIVLVFEKPWQA